MQPYPRSPDVVWPGHLHGTGCLSARAMDAGFPTVVWRLCLGLDCDWARVSAAPRHSWLGWRGGCVLACPLRLYPATPGWAVRCGCVCLGSGYGCAPPLLAGVLGPVRACVPAPLVPRHSCMGCAVCMCVFGLGFRLRPATPGWGVRVCVCLCAYLVCTPPLLAGLCGVGVCAWARVLAAPPRGWLGCWVVCVFVCALLLHRASAGSDVRSGCVCLGLRFGCAPPLLAGVLGCVCFCARSPLVPRHSWLECEVCLCVLGLGCRLRPATPGWGVGVCVCLCACSARTPPLLAGVCCVGVCAWARVLASPRHSWPGCWGVPVCARALLVPRHSWLGSAVWACVLGLGFSLRPATPGWDVRCGCVWLGSGFGCAPPLLAGVLRCVCACVCAPLVSRHSWLGCAVSVCVLGFGFWLRPATPGWGVRCGCVCLASGFGCAPPLVAGVRGVGVCAWARVSAAPRHSWQGCWGVCVLVCALRLYPATPGWGVRCGCVCLGSGFGCTPPLLAGVLGFCVWLCAHSACTPPLLAGVCGLGMCAWALVLAGPRLSWLGLLGCVCAYVCTPLVPRHSWLGCACLDSGFGCAPPLLAGVLGCACLCARSACTPPLLAGLCVLGFGLRLRPATPGWSVGVCMIVCALRLYPATPGWGVRCWCVCLGSGFGCAPPLLAGVCSVGVCGWARASAAPRHSWLGC